jgi:hypothetical protein
MLPRKKTARREAGVEAGDVLPAINGAPITSVEQCRATKKIAPP